MILFLLLGGLLLLLTSIDLVSTVITSILTSIDCTLVVLTIIQPTITILILMAFIFTIVSIDISITSSIDISHGTIIVDPTVIAILTIIR